MIYVLDASVLVKWFVEEPDTRQALSLKSAYLEGACEVASLDFALLRSRQRPPAQQGLFSG